MANTIAASRPLLSGGAVNAYPSILQIPPRNPDGFFTIDCMYTVGAGKFAPFWKSGVQYVVPSGKTFKTAAMLWVSSTSGTSFQLVSSTTIINHNDASITSGVYMGGAAGQTYGFAALASNTYYQMALIYSFSALHYPAVQISGAVNGHIQLLGREV